MTATALPIEDPAPVARRPLRLPPPVTATDRLVSVYAHPGPYTTVYLAIHPIPSGGSLIDRWEPLRRDLAARGASDRALEAITARLALPGPPDVGGIGIVAADDGYTVVEYGLEPPRVDLATHDTLPYAAPMLEWQQRRVAHLVVTVDADGADVVVVGADHFTRVDSYEGSLNELVLPVARTADAIDAELIVLSGDPSIAASLADRLATEVPLTCRTVIEEDHDDIDELSEAIVRRVSDVVARATTDALRESRFLAAHDEVANGRQQTVEALSNGSAERVLLHDDPEDQERIWIGTDPRHLSTEKRSDHVQARLVDALIRSALLQGIELRIIPTTGETGPDEDTAAIVADDHSI